MPRGAITPTRPEPHRGHRQLPRSATPDKPILVHMARTPCQPGLPEHEQNKAGQAELLATSFEMFERNIREQLGAARWPPAASIRRATSPRSPSIAGRTAMRRNTIRCGSRICRRRSSRTSSAAPASAASPSPIRIPAAPPTPTRPSIRRIARSRSCSWPEVPHQAELPLRCRSCISPAGNLFCSI